MISVIGLATFGTLGVVLLGRFQVHRIDDQLEPVAADLRTAQRPPPPPTRGGAAQVPSEFRLMFFDNDGKPLGTLGAPADTSTYPALPAMDLDTTRARGEEPFTVDDQQDSTHWRVRTFVQPPNQTQPQGGTAAVAVSLAAAEATTARLRDIELAAGAVLLLTMSVTAAVLVRLGLLPLTRITQTADAIAAGDLDRRVPDADSHTEAGQLATSFNVMVTRLATAMRDSEASEQRMRSFIADASHELRTPLTTIRGYAEFFRRDPDHTAADALEMMAPIEAAAIRMSGLVDELLLLAELDEQRPLDLVRVDLGALAADVVRDACHRTTRRIVRTGDTCGVQVVGDKQRLHQAVTNLVNNALVHTPDTARITVRVNVIDADPTARSPVTAQAGPRLPQVDRYLVIEVADTGPGIAPDKAPHVFDRFYKASQSRTGNSGSGLGLSITAAIVAAHSGRLQLITRPGEGTTVQIVLPAA
jgi:two-component system OmpR family sensor kinase